MLAAANGTDRRTKSFGIPQESAYGYEQAARVGDIVYVSGQISYDMDGAVVAPAPLDGAGKPSDFAKRDCADRLNQRQL